MRRSSSSRGRARRVPDARLALAVHLNRAAASDDEVTALRQALRDYFAHRAAEARLRLRRLFRTGRWNLLIGVLFVALAIFIGDLVGGLVGRYNYGRLIAESIAIGAWVALWRPIEIFLYDWWPIRAEARLHDRLSRMPVEVIDRPRASADRRRRADDRRTTKAAKGPRAMPELANHTSRHARPGIALGLRSVAFLALWIVLMGSASDQLVFGLITAVIAAWTSFRLLPPGCIRLRPMGLLVLLPHFLWQSVVAGVDVARRAFDPRLPLAPGFVVFHPRTPPGPARNALMSYSSLLPGTVPCGESRRRRDLSLPRCWPADRRAAGRGRVAAAVRHRAGRRQRWLSSCWPAHSSWL